jgi:hypothetical protein
MEEKEQGLEQEQDTASVVDIVDDSTDFSYLDQKKYMRIVERNMKKELERREWRDDNEKYGKGIPTNYNLDGTMEDLLNFIYWKCDCCQDSFQRVKPALYDNLFTEGGKNVMVRRNNVDRKIPLCNTCITLYFYKGWLVVNGLPSKDMLRNTMITYKRETE